MPRLDPVAIARLAMGAGLSDAHAGMAVAIALAESGGDTSEVSRTGDYGLWQINAAAHPKYDRGRLTSDPAYNAKAMADISAGGTNWRPWAVFWSNPFKSGAGDGPYRQHVKVAGEAVKAAGGSLPEVGLDDYVPDVITDPLEAVGAFLGKLMDPAFWRRIGLGAGGVALIVLALVILGRELIVRTASDALGAATK